MRFSFTLLPECEFNIIDEDGNSLLSFHYCEGGSIPSESKLTRIVELLNKGIQFESEKKYWNCKTHGESKNSWGCPECVKELREKTAHLQAELQEAEHAYELVENELTFDQRGRLGPTEDAPQTVRRIIQQRNSANEKVAELEHANNLNKLSKAEINGDQTCPSCGRIGFSIDEFLSPYNGKCSDCQWKPKIDITYRDGSVIKFFPSHKLFFAINELLVKEGC